MEINNGLRSVLKISWAYELFQWLVGSRGAKKWLAENAWDIREGQTVVDAGCGPGTLLIHLPKAVTYFGFDISEAYIRAAQSRFANRGEFVCGTAEQFINEKTELEGAVDLVLTNGLLHHLDDHDAIELLKVSRQLLKPGGRFISIEPTFLRHQQWLSRWIISKDRGQNVRHEHQWRKLASSVFKDHETSIMTGLIRIPYTHILIEAQK